MSYKGPIELFTTDPFIETIKQETDEYIYRAVIKSDVAVDRDELIRALSYDRGQYQKGYADGVAEERARWIGTVEELEKTVKAFKEES